MRRINSWEQVPGQLIDTVIYKRMEVVIYFDEIEMTLSVEPDEMGPAAWFYNADVPWDEADILEPEFFCGKRIKKVVVPFFDSSGRGDAGIMFYFDDGTKALLAPDDWGTPLRIT